MLAQTVKVLLLVLELLLELLELLLLTLADGVIFVGLLALLESVAVLLISISAIVCRQIG